LLLAVFLGVARSSKAEQVPANAVQYLPMLKEQMAEYWPQFKRVDYMAGQIEQESCISLKHPRCWNPKSELRIKYKDSEVLRENGVNFGQTTIARNPDGTIKFDMMKELGKRDEMLSHWTFEDRFNPKMGIRAILVLNKSNYNAIKWPVADEDQKDAFMYAYYNGGSSYTNVKLCRLKKGCDHTRWFGNAALTSAKSHQAAHGYGQSFYDINSSYPLHVMCERPFKYQRLLGVEYEKSLDCADAHPY